MFESVYFGTIRIQPWEILALPFYLLIIYIIANRIKRKRIDENPLYKFYVWGLFAKIIGGIGLVIIYMYWWNGGDTTSYYESALAMKNLLVSSPADWFVNEFGKNTYDNFFLFSYDTGYPLKYMYFDPKTFMVIRLVNPLLLFSFSSYLLTTVLLDWLAYAGTWRLFLVFSKYYPNRTNLFALACLFFPSVLFWGSGILKDCITLSCTGWVVYCIYKAFVLKEKRIRYIIILLVALFLIFSIKPYIIFALLPGSLMWIFANRISAIRNVAFKILIIPLILVISIGGGTFLLSLFGDSLGKFSVDKIANTLVVTQNDLKQSYYHGHSFDIGITDPSPLGLLKKSPEALVAGLYRPFLWESGNAVMLISGIENTLILFLTISSIFQMSLVSFFRKLLQEPLLFFSISFALFFAFSVGISTANFGALVRFKIAYLPFFLCSLFILIKRKEEKELESAMRRNN
jgi:hypothetical protein